LPYVIAIHDERDAQEQTAKTQNPDRGDNSSDPRAIRSGLATDGYLIRSSLTVEEALEQSKSWQPEIVIADEAVADFSEQTFFKALRASNINSSLLIRSDSRTSFVELLDRGADDCIERSCSVAEARARVRSKLYKFHRPVTGQ
jgi:DNA-binding response OmpR family regulator